MEELEKEKQRLLELASGWKILTNAFIHKMKTATGQDRSQKIVSIACKVTGSNCT